jgi:hypothetical protein
MAYEIKMPQLGMNQDSATIVTWLKNEGEKVNEGDPVFEVETDKATMEVEAQASGYLSAIQVELGVEVPVGNLIATIVENKKDVLKSIQEANPDNKSQSDADDGSKIDHEIITEKSNEAVPKIGDLPLKIDNSSKDVSKKIRSSPNEKVLASPKAKVIAAERGLDMSRLRALGLNEPIHSADITGLQFGEQSQLMAIVQDRLLLELIQTSKEIDKGNIFASFLHGSWHFLFPGKFLHVQINKLDGSVSLVKKDILLEEGADEVTISIINLCETRLFSYTSGQNGNVLSVSHSNDTFILNFSFNVADIKLEEASLLLSELAERVEDPIRQLI